MLGGAAKRKIELIAVQNQSLPEPNDPMILGPGEREACQYIAELCEGMLLLEGVSRLPKLGLQLLVLHALCLDYVAFARRSGVVATG